MNSYSRLCLLGIITLCQASQLRGDGPLSLRIEDEPETTFTPAYTAEELATPPIGEIKKLYLRDVNFCRAWLGQLITGASAEEKGEPVFSMMQSCETML